MKTCWKCKESKPFADFNKASDRKDGLQGKCRECGKTSSAEYQQANRVAINARHARYRTENPELVAAQKRSWSQANYDPDVERQRRLVRKYGLSQADFGLILESQGGGCAGGHDWSGPWHVDHDHSCCSGDRTCGSCVRGILCPGCNVALGMVGDSIERLLALAGYLGVKS